MVWLHLSVSFITASTCKEDLPVLVMIAKLGLDEFSLGEELSKQQISDWKKSKKRKMSNSIACTGVNGFVVYTKQWNMFCTMTSEPGGQRADTKLVCAHDTDLMQWPGTASQQTGQTTEVESSPSDRGKLSRHSSLSVSTMTHLPSSLHPPPPPSSKH